MGKASVRQPLWLGRLTRAGGEDDNNKGSTTSEGIHSLLAFGKCCLPASRSAWPPRQTYTCRVETYLVRTPSLAQRQLLMLTNSHLQYHYHHAGAWHFKEHVHETSRCDFLVHMECRLHPMYLVKGSTCLLDGLDRSFESHTSLDYKSPS